MTEPRRYVRSVEVEFGGMVITLAPLRGLKNIRAFEEAVVEEVRNLQQRVEKYAQVGARVSAEALLETGVDRERLLRLGAPGVITDELLDNAAAAECLGVLIDVLDLNNMSRYSTFLSPELMIELAQKLTRMAPPPFPTPERNGNSSELASIGSASSTS